MSSGASKQGSVRLLGETLVRFSEGRRLPLPPNDRPTYRTIYNWCAIGVKSVSQKRTVRLERIKIGPYWYTSVEAFSRWIEALNDELD